MSYDNEQQYNYEAGQQCGSDYHYGHNVENLGFFDENPVLRKLGIILIALGIIIIFASLKTMKNHDEEIDEVITATDVYDATMEEEFVGCKMKYLSDIFASYESMDNLHFRMVLDEEWQCSIVCLHSDDMEQYNKYYEWTYSDDDSLEEPEQIWICGYSQPFNDELKEYIIEGANYFFGDEYITEDNFTDYFGEYYLMVSNKSDYFDFFVWVIYGVVAGIVVILIGCFLLLVKTNHQIIAHYYNHGEIKSFEWSGFCGALIGSALTIILFVIFQQYISSFLLGIAAFFLIFFGYKKCSYQNDKTGKVMTIILLMVVIGVGYYFSWGWEYYQILNKNLHGYISFEKAFKDLAIYVFAQDRILSFFGGLILSYVSSLLGSLYVYRRTYRLRNN